MNEICSTDEEKRNLQYPGKRIVNIVCASENSGVSDCFNNFNIISLRR